MGAILAPGMSAQELLSVPLGTLPASGKMGFYVRLRGTSRMVVSVVRGTHSLVDEPSIVPQLESGAQFRELIVAPDKAAWTSADDAPTAIRLAAAPPDASATTPSVTYIQVDCVLPILVR
jgi:hypothetical protein